jgi:hypothetical protein
MAGEDLAGERAASDEPGALSETAWTHPSIVPARPFIPMVPNLIGAIAGFLTLLIAPWACLKILERILEDDIIQDKVGGWLTVMSLEDNAFIALVGALLFLAIGLILQAWDYRHPFPLRWAVWLAYPIALGLIVPDTLLRGGTTLAGSILAVAIATAFALQWITVVALREEMD